MEESSTFLVPSFSNPSTQEEKGNPLERALTTSISFGRFMSESLDWEKWSAFTQNRHLEEAEKCSRPGSVAEKKAYFEAHFKRRRAAALLEQQSADFAQPNTHGQTEDKSVDAAFAATRLEVVVEQVSEKLINQDENVGCFSDIVSRIVEDDKRRTKTPVKAIAKSLQLKTPHKTTMSSNKRRSIEKHTTIHLPKVENSRIVMRAPPKRFKNTPTSTTASVSGPLKHENNRILRSHGDSISRATAVDDKVHTQSSNYFKSLHLSKIKTQTPTVPATFTFKTEERAVKRREASQKLEQKTKSEKHQIHAKLQTKTRSTNNDLHNSVELETTKKAQFTPRNLTKKVFDGHKLQIPTCFLVTEERSAFKSVQGNDTRPPWRVSMKNESSNDLNGKKSHPRCFSKKNANENAPPNLQL